MRDWCLAEALLYYEASLNPLGIPSWIARDPERSWVPDEINDLALAALDEAEAEMRRGNGDNYGVRLTVVESNQPRSAKARQSSEKPTRNRDETLG